MKKVLISLLVAFLFVSVAGIAAETDPIQDWGNVDGVTVQTDERLEKIKAYKKKLKAAEKKKLREGWEEEGIIVQPEERVRELNEMQKKRREKEIRKLKCAMCQLRCTLVRDAGESACKSSSTLPDSKLCARNAANFLSSCMQQCNHC